MLTKTLSNIDLAIGRLVDPNTINTNYLGLTRSILATGTLLTLAFTDSDVLFKPDGNMYPISKIFLQQLNLFRMFPYELIWVSKLIAILILLLVISGRFPKITSVLHAWVSLSFINAVVMIEGGDQITSNLTLLLIPVCWTDPRNNLWKFRSPIKGSFENEQKLISNFFYSLIKIQVALLYLQSSIGKINIEDWSNGTAVYYWFNNPTFGLVDGLKPIFNSILANPYIIVSISYGVILFEFCLFLGIFLNQRNKNRLLISGIIFHFFILMIHGLFSFYFSMTAALILYLAPIRNDFRLAFLDGIRKRKA
jgi:antimicrobial peptide system SdpB family protein